MEADQTRSTLKHANELLRKGDLDQAKSSYTELLARQPQLRSLIEFNLGVLARRQRRARPRSKTDLKIVVYTVLVGDYEPLKEPAVKDPDCTYLLFTDNPNLKSDGWTVVPFDTLGLSPRRASRLPKLLPHRYLPEHDVSVYFDASLTVVEPNISAMVNEALDGADIAAYPHYCRQCVFEEIEECLRLKKVDEHAIEPLRKRLIKEQYPLNWGLLENAILVRKASPVMRVVNDLWFKEFLDGPERDQFSLMYVLWRAEVPYAKIDNARDFRKSPHARWTKHEYRVFRNPTARKLQSRCHDLIQYLDRRRLQDRADRALTAVCIALDQQGKGFGKALREAFEVITLMDLSGLIASKKTRVDLADLLFSSAPSVKCSIPDRMAYVASSEMPSVAANNVHVMRMCSAFSKNQMPIKLYALANESVINEQKSSIFQQFGVDEPFELHLEDLAGREREYGLLCIVRRLIREGCSNVYTRSLEVAALAGLADMPVALEEHKAQKETKFFMLSALLRGDSFKNLVVISNPLAKIYAPVYKGTHKKIVVLHDGADLPPPTLPDFDLVRRNSAGVDVGYVGHLYAGKGAEIAVELAGLMPEVNFHMLGGMPEDVKTWRLRTASLPNINFYGHRPHSEVGAFINSVDICIAPFLRKVSVFGGKYNVADFFSPLKLFEYMAHGKPIIASDLPVLREVIESGVNALLCNPDAPSEFVDAINALAERPEYAAKLGRNARTKLEREYTWGIRAKRISALFERIAVSDDPGFLKPSVIPESHKGKKPVLRWCFGGASQQGWAYGVNAQRLSENIKTLSHNLESTYSPTQVRPDVALAFDILLACQEDFESLDAQCKILRVGGPNPLNVFCGGDEDKLAQKLEEFDAIIALSPQLRDFLSNWHPFVSFIPNGIDLASFRPAVRARGSSQKFTAGFSAAVGKERQKIVKGLHIAEEACGRLGITLLKAGKGGNHVPHNKLIEEFYSKIDVLVHPVAPGKEASSNVIMEALALGVPVVTTRHAGFHGAALVNGSQGLIVRRTIGDVTRAIYELRADKALYERLCQGGRKFVERHHCLKTVARKYESVIWSCLNEKENVSNGGKKR